MQNASANAQGEAGQISYNTKIAKNSPGVKNNSMQSAEKNADSEYLSIDIDDIAGDQSAGRLCSGVEKCRATCANR
ncbi:MAG: hypothetical protein IJN42_00815 [Clostridia bacterium]|nr:hypothetical protein [Clostridia bacterium]